MAEWRPGSGNRVVTAHIFKSQAGSTKQTITSTNLLFSKSPPPKPYLLSLSSIINWGLKTQMPEMTQSFLIHTVTVCNGLSTYHSRMWENSLELWVARLGMPWAGVLNKNEKGRWTLASVAPSFLPEDVWVASVCSDGLWPWTVSEG